MNRFTVILKNGKEFSFDALDMDVTYDVNTGGIDKIRWYGAKGILPLYICPSEVAVVYYEKLTEETNDDT